MANEGPANVKPNVEASDSLVKRSPGKDLMSKKGIAAVTIYLFITIILIMWALIVLWPPLKPDQQASASPTPTPSPSASGSPTPSVTASPATRPTPTPTPTPTVSPASTPAAGNGAAGTNATPGPTASATPIASSACETTNRIKGEYCLDDQGKIRKGVSPWRALGSCGCMYDEDRLLFIVLLAGALGSLIHGLRSFVWYVGNRRAVWSWSAYYVALPLIGSGLSFIFYLVIRGGFFSPSAPAELTSPVGFAAVAALIGMFTEQAVQKLKGVSETILAPAEKGKDHIGGPKINAIAPAQGPPGGGNEVKIAGENFSTPIKVKFGTVEALLVGEPATDSITVTAPPHPDGKEAKVDVVVINSDSQQDTKRDGYEYKKPDAPAAETSTTAQPVTGEGGDLDAVDGCDVKLEADTADEALPITEGGVG